MSSGHVKAPLPRYKEKAQAGIADPIWPPEPPVGVDAKLYAKFYAGTVDRQRHLHILTADLAVASRLEVESALTKLRTVAEDQMLKKPPPFAGRPLDVPVESNRVTISVGFGATFFTTVHGDDRFGIAAQRPRGLKVMPALGGEAPGFKPTSEASDLIILISSDDLYVNEFILGLLYYAKVVPQLRIRRVERGYARPDSREPTGFDDGSTNPRELPPDYPLRSFVFVAENDGEPDWCVGGTYLAYRKIRRRLSRFFDLSVPAREDVFGASRDTGARLPNPKPNAHVVKVNPRRTTPDLFERMDDSRRFLRRPYFYDDGLDASGEENRGIHHLGFVRDLVSQYEWPVRMWQMNPDFPAKATGIDPIYQVGGASNVGGGYYFFPPRPTSGHYASMIFAG